MSFRQCQRQRDGDVRDLFFGGVWVSTDPGRQKDILIGRLWFPRCLVCAARRTLRGSIRNRRRRAATGWPVLTFGGWVPVWEVCMAGRYYGMVSTKLEVCFLLRCVNAPFSSQILTCLMQALSVACSSRPISTCLYRKRVVTSRLKSNIIFHKKEISKEI